MEAIERKDIEMQARQAAAELIEAAHLKAGDLFVVGCSSSEIVGGHIGKDSSMEPPLVRFPELAVFTFCLPF